MPSPDSARPDTLLGLIQAALGRFRHAEEPHGKEPEIIDETVVRAVVAAAAHVIVADGEASPGEFRAALRGMQGSLGLNEVAPEGELETALVAAVQRVRTRSGRIENLRQVGAIADRSEPTRRQVFLLAADVAEVEGISAIEDRALAEIAAALAVDRTALLDARESRVRST